MKYHELIFYIALYASYLLYFIAFFKIGNNDPRYLAHLQEFMKYYVTIFLLIHFNPFVKHKFTEFDRTVVFSSALFLLTTTAFNKFFGDIPYDGLADVIRLLRIVPHL